MAKIARTNVSDEVVTLLLEAIKSGRLKQGDKLPSMEQLADELGVGRSSIREAWRHLQALGMIQITHGKGTFVTSLRLPLDTQISGFSGAIRDRGMKPGSILLERNVAPAPKDIDEALDLSVGEQVNVLHRLRLANDVPLAIQVSYTPNRLFPELLDGPWSLETSLYSTLARKYNVTIAYAKQTIRVSLINQEQAQLLQVKAGDAALELDTIAYTGDGIPFELGHDIYRGDRYQYTVTLKKRN